MTDKFSKLVHALVENRSEIAEVLRDDTEYYFKYRGFTFSLLRQPKPEDKLNLFAYPKWQGDLAKLVELLGRGVEAPNLSFSRVFPREGQDPKLLDQVRTLLKHLQSKHSGIDDMFRELGVE